MDTKVLGIIRELGLAFFLAIVGLNYGYGAVDALTGSGITLALVSLFVGAATDAVGSDEPGAGYGATYPFALFGMVIFTIILNKLPLL